MIISLIAAMAANRAIGRDGLLPWHLKADLQRFKRLTMGHWLIMGRVTFESIGRPLPGRTTVVVTHRPGYAPEGVVIARSIEEALALPQGDEAFVAGGAAIYEQTIDRAERIYLTLIEREYEGDVFFPRFDERGWRLTQDEPHASDGNAPPFRYLTYERNGDPDAPRLP